MQPRAMAPRPAGQAEDDIAATVAHTYPGRHERRVRDNAFPQTRGKAQFVDETLMNRTLPPLIANRQAAPP